MQEAWPPFEAADEVTRYEKRTRALTLHSETKQLGRLALAHDNQLMSSMPPPKHVQAVLGCSKCVNRGGQCPTGLARDETVWQ
jgi:hypothetical protein